MGIEGRLRDLPVGAMSAGQKRRVSIAAVVARRPRLWLLDEPHAGLDQDGRDTVDQLVRDATAGGATVIVASHELERARAMAPRSITIAGGMVVPGAERVQAPGAERVQAPRVPGVANVG
jgi:energy-coupling factor transporter ATP-binding protein EcfA2